jgi:phage terminase large subunit
MPFVRTTAINKILALRGRKKIIQGGTWAGKTYGIIPILINYATQRSNKTITIVAETIPAIKGGALKDFKNIMRDTGRWYESRFNASDLHYTFATGTKIEFKSFDSVGKAQAAGKRDVLFINEAPYIAYDIADALIGRTVEDIYIDFNPTSEFWAHTEILPNKDAEFLLLKYTDNEALPKTIYDELMMKLDKAQREKEQGILNGYWSNWCRVYIDGEIGSLQGVVFNNWTLIDGIPAQAELIAYGLDWGFSNDESGLVAVYKYNGKILLNELIYETGLTNTMLATKMLNIGIPFTAEIIADSSEPKSIADLKNMGYVNVTPAIKGVDSIRHGLDIMQTLEMLVTKSSTNLIKELRGYRWQVDKSGKSINKPIDHMNHLIDPTRYVAINKLSTQEVWDFI